jgi:2-oxoglutarate ferredoxin oxidoreductase subunit beta
MDAAGAVYVARWTVYHVRQLTRAIEEAFGKKGFSFIEIISPCPTLYQRRNRMGDGLSALQYYKQVSKIRNGAPTGEVSLSKSGEITVGTFVDRVRPDFIDLMRARMHETLGGRYVDTLHMEETECQS